MTAGNVLALQAANARMFCCPAGKETPVYRPVKRKARIEIRRDPHLSTVMAAAFSAFTFANMIENCYTWLLEGAALQTALRES
jgi:hypothetical protein